MKKIVLSIVVLLLISGMLFVPFTNSSDAADEDFEQVTFKNSVGTDVTFEEPAQKVASLGIAFTTTLIELDLLENMVMIDNYSDPDNSGITELEGYPSENIFSVGNGEQIAENLANGYGGFDINRDVVIIYGYGYHASAIEKMETFGIKVVTFYPKTYEDSMKMVEDIGSIMGTKAKAKEITDRMESVVTEYAEALGDLTESEKTKAIYVSYSGGKLRVGNVDSYSVIMLKIAGGVNPADNASMTGSSLTSYEVDDTMFLQLDIDVIFLDPAYTGTPSDFRSEKNISDDVRIYKLGKTMNQYGPTSLEGIEYMAKAMYPEVFGYLEEDLGDGPDNNIWLYVAVVALVGVLVGAAIFIYRRR